MQDNFLCAFTAPELLASLDTEYIIECHDDNDNDDYNAKRLLTVWNRKLGRSSAPLLGPTDLACPSGREETSNFFTELCGKKVQCVVAASNKSRGEGATDSIRLSKQHTFQFGNTSSGVKNNKGDTRTIHIINENTVKQFSDAVYGDGELGKSLGSTRFRPNIIVDNLEPWAEFDLIGKTMEIVPTNSNNNNDAQDPPLRFRIVSRTVRCAGVGVDPLHPEQGAIDIPNLLSKHFPEHGPFLGVYAVVVDNKQDDGRPSCSGTISVGDTFRIVGE